MVFQTLGGIGLFLIGMVLLTDGLRALAGSALRRILARFTSTPFRGLLTGAAVTSLVQSSSVTTVATIGFVSAGLLSFPAAVGLIFGANLGTTVTSWIVSLLGLKLNIGAISMPLIAAGALLKLVGKGRAVPLGLSLAGFGLLFVGIDVLQGGMQQLATKIDLNALAGEGMLSRLALVGVGVGMTVIMQSSSAAVATTLVAVHSGTIGLEQASALVIGQSVGTTVSAALAAIGASIPARRTALAHVLFNVIAGVFAFFLLPVFTGGLEAALGTTAQHDAATMVAAFHTCFKLFGVCLLLPNARRFSDLILRIMPDRGPQLTAHLDPSLLAVRPVAIETGRRAIADAVSLLLATLAQHLTAPAGHRRPLEPDTQTTETALVATRDFLAKLGNGGLDSHGENSGLLALLHSLDHAERLVAAARQTDSLHIAAESQRLEPVRVLTVEQNRLARQILTPPGPGTANVAIESVGHISQQLADMRRALRPELLARTAQGELGPSEALSLLEGLHWLDRVAYHTWRATHYLASPEPLGQ